MTDMKKAYMKPEMQEVIVNIHQPLMTASVTIYDDPTATDPNELLAPGMTTLPGLPGLNLPGMGL